MSLTITYMNRALKSAALVHQREYARNRAQTALMVALQRVKEAGVGVAEATRQENYRRAIECIEAAEAWIAYLQDPTIIDQPERNLPA